MRTDRDGYQMPEKRKPEKSQGTADVWKMKNRPRFLVLVLYITDTKKTILLNDDDTQTNNNWET